MNISVDDIKKLREETRAGIADCRKALEEAGGDFAKAKELVKSWGLDKAAAKSDRVVGAGLVENYVHGGGKVGSMVEVVEKTKHLLNQGGYWLMMKGGYPTEELAHVTTPYVVHPLLVPGLNARRHVVVITPS